MKKTLTIAMMLCSLALAANSASATSLSLNQASNDQLDLVVSDLNPYVLAGFDVDITYDPSGAAINNVTFGDRLGDPNNASQTLAFWLDDLLGTLNIYELSFLFPDALFGLQSGLSSFILASVTFADDVDVNNLLISRADLALDSAAPVPEPATLLLFGTGMAGLAAIRRRATRA